ncbi:MAG: sugar phosphate isomerase/epimerase [Planctomycetes bacterium]|nr:sugar phosphate isomerase/epimerase [Planctomycetota bacterium]
MVDLNRREFLAASAGLAAAWGIGGKATTVAAAEPDAPAFKTQLKKALIVGKPDEETLKRYKAAGFDGVEAHAASVEDAAKCREMAEKIGMRIHSVLRGWAEFNSRDPGKVESSFKVTADALRAAKAYGADAVLLVPCRIGGMPMPRPWEFLIDFDPATGHIRTVTAGDNAPFKAYIEAHDHASDTSKEMIRKLIPVAEETGVVIAVENVWNNLWVRPDFFRNFIASFASPWVKAYFDIANHVKYGRPEEWILTLADLIVKCHVKEFKLNPSDPNGGGSWPDIRDGSVRWPVVRQAIERIGYSGWMTIEGGSCSPEEHSKRLDLIIAGK